MGVNNKIEIRRTISFVFKRFANLRAKIPTRVVNYLLPFDWESRVFSVYNRISHKIVRIESSFISAVVPQEPNQRIS